MKVDLRGHVYHLVGLRHAVSDAVLEGLRANGAEARWAGAEEGPVAVGLIVSHCLDPSTRPAEQPLVADAARRAREMAERGRGRVVHLLTTLGLVAMRRHPEFSISQAGIVASIRTLAMACAPNVLVNGVAAGCVADDAGGPAAGDPAMLSHVTTGRSGAVRDIVHAVLFLCDPLNSYTTGQVLAVDGGWAAGYARDF